MCLEYEDVESYFVIYKVPVELKQKKENKLISNV